MSQGRHFDMIPRTLLTILGPFSATICLFRMLRRKIIEKRSIAFFLGMQMQQTITLPCIQPENFIAVPNRDTIAAGAW